MDPLVHTAVWAGTAAGVLVSRDSGATWNFPPIQTPQTDIPGLAADGVGGLYAIDAGVLSDAFAMKLDPTGQQIVYSTYLGGGGMDAAQAIAVDGSGNAYITGYTDSFDFPTVSALQPQPRGGRDGFISVLNSTGAKLLWSTYLGGNGNDFPAAIALDAAGNIHLAGWTESTNFPLKNAPATRVAADTGSFAAKLKSDGSALLFSTYLGGSGTDLAAAVAADSSGNTYVAGVTRSPDLPTKNAIQPQLRGITNAFIAAYDDEGGPVQFLSYLGGNSNDQGTSIAIAPSGMVYLVGSTTSSDFPQLDPIQNASGGGQDAFVAIITLRQIADRPGKR